MYFLFSGEGATDLGLGLPGTLIAEGDQYRHGPMTVFADRIVESPHRYSPLQSRCCGYISEHDVAARGHELKAARKMLALPGAKVPKETRYFFNTARLLSRFARDKGAERNDDVVAVLFRDSDDTASAGRGLWPDKHKSMLDGFAEEGFSRGVPMIPKPKSEAWIICALKDNPYVGCDPLEDRSGNDRSPNSLKGELERLLGEPATRELLLSKIEDGSIDCHRNTMPSFLSFRRRLEEVIDKSTPRKPW
ncbi:MAG: hypothetical protein ACLQU5_18645 [Isosphaeraceae bacterium]